MPIERTPKAPEFKAPDATPETSPEVLEAPAASVDFSEYLYVQFPDGTVRAVPNDRVRTLNGQGGVVPLAGPDPSDATEVYVHLANGDVERVMERDLPGAAGTNAQHGYFEKNGNTHQIVGVYPVETPNGK